jgi:hypothetical protein
VTKGEARKIEGVGINDPFAYENKVFKIAKNVPK